MRKSDIKLAIASFAGKTRKSTNELYGKELIQKILENKIQDFHIESFYPLSKTFKSTHLANIMKHYQIYDKAKVLLIDNDYRNVKYAVDEGYNSWHVKKSKGFEFSSLVVVN